MTAVALAPNVWRLPTAPMSLVNSYGFREDDGRVTLVDCGTSGAPARLLAGLAAMGAAPQDVTRILLTHAHPDHAGGLAEMRRRAGGPEVVAHTDDAGAIRRGESPPRDPRRGLARLLERLPGGGWEGSPVDAEVADGQVLDVAGGLRVVHTPGHTPGHVSLLHEPSGVLVTGDAIFHVGRITWPPLFLCTDAPLTKRTAHVLGELDYRVAAFTHGTEIRDRARERVRDFLRRRAPAG
jgi:glyoxylase-like metal-dependent hydrolase (beta-lactamase superfamily II)